MRVVVSETKKRWIQEKHVDGYFLIYSPTRKHVYKCIDGISLKEESDTDQTNNRIITTGAVDWLFLPFSFFMFLILYRLVLLEICHERNIVRCVSETFDILPLPHQFSYFCLAPCSNDMGKHSFIYQHVSMIFGEWSCSQISNPCIGTALSWVKIVKVGISKGTCVIYGGICM